MKPVVYSAVAVLALTACLGVVHASGPIAVYALVDKVTLEPNADQPATIRIDGVFSASGERNDVYSAPQRGYLYFKLPPRNADLAAREWNDMKSVAGSHQVIAFGSNWMGDVRVRIRKPDEEAKSPEEYPMGNGVIRVNADHPKAKALLEYK